MIQNLSIGRPGVGALAVAASGFVFTSGQDVEYLVGGRIIDGTLARDPGNDDPTTLRPGLLMGRVPGTGKYANAVYGKTLAAISAGATSFSLSALAAVEFVRRNGGSTGSVVIVGPPTAGGTVAAQTVTVTAVNTTTGVFTGTVPAAVVTDSAVTPTDGTGVPITVIGDGYGYIIPTTGDAEWPRVPVEGQIDETRLIDWPADVASRAYLRNQLSTLAGAKFTFSKAM